MPALCAALIDLANERGGPDNITVVAARFDGTGLPDPDPEDGVGYRKFPLAEGEPVTMEHPAPAPMAAVVGPQAGSGPRAVAVMAALLGLIGLLALYLVFR
jgi:protein phosphatase